MDFAFGGLQNTPANYESVSLLSRSLISPAKLLYFIKQRLNPSVLEYSGHESSCLLGVKDGMTAIVLRQIWRCDCQRNLRRYSVP